MCRYFSLPLTPSFSGASLSFPPPFSLFSFISNIAMNAAEVCDKLGLHGLHDRTWYIQATCAISGDGLDEGLDWLKRAIKRAANKRK